MTEIDVVHAVDERRWDDLAGLFGPSGAQRGCWCMAWRLSSRDFTANDGPANRAALRQATRDGRPIGLLGYADGRPVAWCALAPRPAYVRVQRSSLLRPDDADDGSVWSVPCFFVRGGLRRRGLAEVMLAAAVRHAARHGAAVLEGYPVDTKGGTQPGDVHSGTIGLFTRGGFSLYRRPPAGRRVIMRRDLAGVGD